MSRAMRRWASLHVQSLKSALARVAREPVATAMTVLVIAIALALPSGLRVLVGNVSALSSGWQGVTDFGVYLEPGTDEARARALAEQIAGRPDVAGVDLVTSDEALADFRARSGFGAALDALEHNPLPHTIVVRPAGGPDSDLEGLAAALGALPDVDFVQLDTEWVERLRAILALAAYVVDVVSAVLGVGVALVIGNTIRLEINSRAAEIEVVKLVGGTDAFIRRPFLYLGFVYGLAGAGAAALLITAVLALLREPAAALAALYGSDFRLAGLSPLDASVLVGGGALLGLAGAALATSRHLQEIEPR
ncbi:MAG TPA: permease-like cell division protein FtsX [Gammaproteobacteria bacterium]